MEFIRYTKIFTTFPIVQDAACFVNGGITAQDVRMLEAKELFVLSPWLEKAYTLLQTSDPVGRVGKYTAVYQLGLAVEGYTPGEGSDPGVGVIGESEIVKTITFLTYVDKEIVSEEKLHKFLGELCELHPYEHPVIEVGGQCLVPPGLR